MQTRLSSRCVKIWSWTERSGSTDPPRRDRGACAPLPPGRILRSGTLTPVAGSRLLRAPAYFGMNRKP